MKYPLNVVIDYVYSLLDENREILEERVEYSDPGVQLAPFITALLPESARKVINEASIEKIDDCITVAESRFPAADFGTSGGVSTLGRATVGLPDDFLRLVYFRMSDWEEGLSVPMECGSEVHQLRNRKLGTLGYAYQRPAVTVRRRGRNCDLLVYGSHLDASVADLQYVARPAIVNEEIDLPPALFHDVCANVADTVLSVLATPHHTN